ncbi:MAG: GNAT family N-acetyltransferase [Alicyclobacillaceae bacterium]|nr:GNAT family N-acetyltransferase [Alicyclobacillaceae bacterium]
MTVHIKRLTEPAECAQCHRLAAAVWGEESACSVPQMVIHANFGGLVLLAQDGGVPVGFLFSFPARYNTEWVLWSHETAVLPAYQHQGIGTLLKRTQFQVAGEMGYEAVAWTFDPLVARNADFNLNKLGALVEDYRIDVYGPMQGDPINRDLPTDRWIVRRPTTVERSSPETATLTYASAEETVLLSIDNECTPVPQPSIQAVIAGAEGRPMTVQIPLRLDCLLANQPRLAHDWRTNFRTVATNLLEAGYGVSCYRTEAEHGTYVWKKRRAPK